MAPSRSEHYRNPFPTVDIIIEITGPNGRPGVVMIKRKNPPPGWALPGGFVDYGETLEHAAVREAKEETTLDVELLGQLHTYSEPDRDPRFHTISTVFLARAEGTPKAEDDAAEIGIFTAGDLPQPLAFDHAGVLADYFQGKYRAADFPCPANDEKEDQPMNDDQEPKAEKDMKLAELCRVNGPVEAEVIKNFLESQGIACILQGQMLQAIYPILIDGLAEIKVMVSENELEAARQLLKERGTPEGEET